MSDTTTTLNPGSSGDVLDETLALQSDGVTQAKRPRVVIGGNTGWDGSTNDLVLPVKADAGKNPTSLPTLPQCVVNDSPESGYVAGELRSLSMTTDGRLRVASAPARLDTQAFEPDEEGMWGGLTVSCVLSNSPW